VASVERRAFRRPARLAAPRVGSQGRRLLARAALPLARRPQRADSRRAGLRAKRLGRRTRGADAASRARTARRFRGSASPGSPPLRSRAAAARAEPSRDAKSWLRRRASRRAQGAARNGDASSVGVERTRVAAAAGAAADSGRVRAPDGGATVCGRARRRNRRARSGSGGFRREGQARDYVTRSVATSVPTSAAAGARGRPGNSTASFC
jgi:hypothetical protein